MTAALLLAKWLLIPCGAGVLIFAVTWHHPPLIWLGLGLVGLSVTLGVVQRVTAADCRCPLCLGLPLGRSGASRHRNSRRLFGSYRLRVANAITFRGSFRCPYCGEPTAMRVRNR